MACVGGYSSTRIWGRGMGCLELGRGEDEVCDAQEVELRRVGIYVW
jgi:hypothetical protein